MLRPPLAVTLTVVFVCALGSPAGCTTTETASEREATREAAQSEGVDRHVAELVARLFEGQGDVRVSPVLPQQMDPLYAAERRSAALVEQDARRVWVVGRLHCQQESATAWALDVELEVTDLERREGGSRTREVFHGEGGGVGEACARAFDAAAAALAPSFPAQVLASLAPPPDDEGVKDPTEAPLGGAPVSGPGSSP